MVLPLWDFCNILLPCLLPILGSKASIVSLRAASTRIKQALFKPFWAHIKLVISHRQDENSDRMYQTMAKIMNTALKMKFRLESQNDSWVGVFFRENPDAVSILAVLKNYLFLTKHEFLMFAFASKPI